MIKFLVARALARLPEALRGRYEAEWQADLAELSRRRLTALRWAIGLQHASAEIGAQSGIKHPTRVPRLAFDAVTLALAYYAAYLLRFGANIPERYQELLLQTLPFAIVGGLVCMALTGNYGATATGTVQIIKGVALATIALVAYTAVARPALIDAPRAVTALNVPIGVSLLFALAAVTAVLATRALLHRTYAKPQS